MLTLPDIKAKQILFIQPEHGAKNRLFFKNENIVFEKNGEIVNQASCHKVLAAFIIGDFSFTSRLVKECRGKAVSLFFLNYNFGVYGALNAKAEGNYLLRGKQYSASAEQELAIAKNIVKNKIQNQIRLLKSVGKFSDEQSAVKTLSAVEMAKKGEELLGLEGSFTKLFFSRYFEEINWWRRMPRAKQDIPNVLLDIGYTFLFNFIDSLLLLFGFDTYKGYYHKLFFQRKSLSCDIVEPFRCIIEKQLLKAHRLKQIDEKDFFIEQGKYVLTYKESQKYAKIFMDAVMDNKEAIYLYVQKFYRSIMLPNNRFPEFDIIAKQTK
jgi:CRISPR-associated protein Cas1